MRGRLRRAWLLGSSLAMLLTVGAAVMPGSAEAATSYPFVVRVNYGPAGEAGSKGCTGTLIGDRWVVTASSCFPQPGPDSTPDGRQDPLIPNKPSSVTFSADAGAMSGKSVRIVDVDWSADRAILNLATPITGVTPLTSTAAVPDTGNQLLAVGLGRTSTEWVPATAHQIEYKVTNDPVPTNKYALELAPVAQDATGLCQGDAGAPLLKIGETGPAWAGMITGAGQKGCLGVTSSLSTAVALRPSLTLRSLPRFWADFEEPETPPFISTPYNATSVKNIGGYCCNLTGPELKPTNENTAARPSRGPGSLLYSGVDKNATSSFAYMKVYAPTNVNVGAGSALSYWIYPQGTPKATASNSTCVAVDLVLDDGRTLRDSRAVDQNGVSIHPAKQCKHLKLNEWNQVVVEIDRNTLFSGKVTAVLVGYDQPAGTGSYRGYIDNITIGTIGCLPGETPPMGGCSSSRG